MNMFGIVLSFLLFQAISLNANPVGTASFEELRSLCVRETGFDFCGLSCDAKTNAVGFSERDLRARLFAGVSHYEFRLEFQNLLQLLDCAAIENNRREFLAIAAQIGVMLERQRGKAQEENDKWLLLHRCMERILYEMARVSESGFPLDAGDLDQILPERLFVPSPKKIHRRTYYLLVGFRKLLIIGQKIRQFRVGQGCFPRTVEEMNLPEDFLRLENGMSLHYLTDDRAWHLWYGGTRCDEKNMAFNVYVPTLKVDELSKWPFGGCPNYSSDYSRKRILAYRDGAVLNSSSDLWRCELINGKFIRKK